MVLVHGAHDIGHELASRGVVEVLGGTDEFHTAAAQKLHHLHLIADVPGPGEKSLKTMT